MRRKTRKRLLVGAGAAVLLALLACFAWLCAVPQPEAEVGGAPCAATPLARARQQARAYVRAKFRRAARNEPSGAARRREAARKRRTAVRRIFLRRGFTASASYVKAAEMPRGDPAAEDQEIIDLAGEAASEEDLDTAADVLEAALNSQDPRARLAAVEMLSGLGEAGLADLASFLEDAHPEVANLAADRWELGIQNLTDAREQAAFARVGFLAITDADQLRSLGGTLMLVPDAKLALGVLAEVIRDGATIQREAAKEAYEGVTGEKWVDEASAEAWLAEHYEPPEEPEESDEPTQGEYDAEGQGSDDVR